MFCVWAIVLVMIDKKADKFYKNNVMAKLEEVQKEILDRFEDIAKLTKEEQKVLYCVNCGIRINEGDKTCSQCDSNLQKKKINVLFSLK